MCLASCGGGRGGGRLAWLVGRGLMFGPPVCPLQRHNVEESRQDGLRAYHPSFWVSGAILSSTPSFSVIGHNSVSWAAHTLVKGAVCRWCMDRESEREEGRAIHTKIIDVEHAAHSATCPAVPDLGLGRRGRCIINGRINLGQGGQRFLHFSGHDGW